MKERQFYCVLCRKKVMCPAEDIHFKMLKNKKIKGGMPALKCGCQKCGTRLTKFVKRKDAKRLKAKY